MIRLRQSTASQEIQIGPFLDATDGSTAETGLTIANTDIKVWKAGATSRANKNSGGATHMDGGFYYAVLDATDTNTVGPLVVTVHVAGALPCRVECEVLSAAQFDHLFGTKAPLTPTTAGRELDVSAGGAAGVDWANVEAPTTTVNLSGTTVKTATDIATAIASLATASSVSALASTLATILGHVDTEVAAILARLPSALVGGKMDSTITGLTDGSIGAGTLTAAACEKVADILLRRSLTSVEGSANGDSLALGSLLGAALSLVGRVVATDTELRVYRANGTTILHTAAIQTDADSRPIVSRTP